jgi:hypothetical protein
MNTKKLTKSNKNLKRKFRRLKRTKRRRQGNVSLRRALPFKRGRVAAATSLQFKKKFKVFRQAGNSVRVSGRDLMYTIPDDNTSPIQTTQVITVIPANPVYWLGTRISALAKGYQNYRPIKFKVTYVPIVSVNQQGNVIGGTVWDGGIQNDNIQQSLRTSNGGFLTQCYAPHTVTIRPKTNLQFNLYRVGGAFNQESNPFIFTALAIGCKVNNTRIVPGYFYVTWCFELKNPIGANSTYFNTGLITYENLPRKINSTVINVNTTSEVPFGAYIDVEYENDTKIAKYNGTPITITNSTPIWAFQSINLANTTTFAKIPIYYDSLTTNKPINISFKQGSSTTVVIVKVGQSYKSYMFESYTDTGATAICQFSPDEEGPFFVTDNEKQNFGTYDQTVTKQTGMYRVTYSTYLAPLTQYTLDIATAAINQIHHDRCIFLTNKMNDIDLNDIPEDVDSVEDDEEIKEEIEPKPKQKKRDLPKKNN